MPYPIARTPVNQAYKNDDLALWEAYKRNPTTMNRAALLMRFDGLIQSQVNRWGGPVARDVLVNEAKLLAVKAIDNYNPNAGTALGAHLTNQLLPLSRIVYTYLYVFLHRHNIFAYISLTIK